MNNKNELLDDSWKEGPCYRKSVKRKLPIQVALEYIKLKCKRKPSKNPKISGDIPLEEVDTDIVADGDDQQPPPTAEPREYTFSIENTPKHPVQLMVCIIDSYCNS